MMFFSKLFVACKNRSIHIVVLPKTKKNIFSILENSTFRFKTEKKKKLSSN